MSNLALEYAAQQIIGSSSDLVAYYDFISPSVVGLTSNGSIYTGAVINQLSTASTGEYIAYALGATGISEASAVNSGVAALSGGANLDISNLKIENQNMSLNNMSCLIDFEWNGEVEDGVIFGCYDLFQENLGGVDVTGSRGFNFGFDARGRLFFQSYSSKGQQIASFVGMELSKRNVISLSLNNGRIEMANYDLYDDSYQSYIYNLNSDYLSSVDEFYIGGTKEYFSTTGAVDLTIDGKICHLALLNKAYTPFVLKDLTSGFYSDYYLTTGTQTVTGTVTGFAETIVYQTGITGIEMVQTGSLIVETGGFLYSETTGTPTIISGATEGHENYESRFLGNDFYSLSFDQRKGYIDESNVTYYPFGQRAEDTLGLTSGVVTVSGETIYTLTRVVETGTYPLYGQQYLTGTLDIVSGITQTPLTGFTTGTTADQSGISFTGDLSDFKRNYIYYKGVRNE